MKKRHSIHLLLAAAALLLATAACTKDELADGEGSVFDTGDPFAVQIDDGTETATYTVQDDGTATSDAPLYWTNTTPNRTVSAWYPATDGTLDLGDQSQSLAYLLGGSGTGDYQTPVTLTFTHRCTRRSAEPPALYLHTVYL